MTNQFTPQQKLQLLREIENNLSIGLLKSLEFHREIIDNMNKEYRKDKEKLSTEMKNLIKEFELKDGYTPLSGKDYPNEQQIIGFIGKYIDNLTPKKGKDYFTQDEINSIVESVKKDIEDGDDGDDGDDGYNPEPGIDYPTIEQIELFAKNYIDSQKNERAIKITSKEIYDKLNDTEETVNISVIKGLKDIISKLQKAIRQRGGGGTGGGGMGNIVTESFSVSSATTSITLSRAVASNGRAIWLNYQGQQQAYATHFTVSGKNVPLLFTPQDSTFIDVIYIRK